MYIGYSNALLIKMIIMKTSNILLAILALLFLFFSCSSSKGSIEVVHKDTLVGTWRLIEPRNLQAVKTFTPTHFSWYHIDSSGRAVASGAGEYKITSASTFTESVQIVGNQPIEMKGSSTNMNYQIVGDTMIVAVNLHADKGSQFTYSEKWVRMQ